jgi:hypothetical protein
MHIEFWVCVIAKSEFWSHNNDSSFMQYVILTYRQSEHGLTVKELHVNLILNSKEHFTLLLSISFITSSVKRLLST